MQDISAALLEAIKSKGLSYAELERLTGVSKSALQRYATGKTKKVPVDVIEKIAKATGSSLLRDIAWNEDIDNILSSMIHRDPIHEYLEYQFRNENEIEAAFEIIAELSKLNYDGLIELKKNLNIYCRLEEYTSK